MRKLSISADWVGSLLLVLLALNRCIYAYIKHTRYDLVYTGSVIVEDHWLERILPMHSWTWIWGCITLLVFTGIIFPKINKWIVAIVSSLFTIWGLSALSSPQTTAFITGSMWIIVSSLVIWGYSRLSPDEVYTETVDEYIKRRGDE